MCIYCRVYSLATESLSIYEIFVVALQGRESQVVTVEHGERKVIDIDEVRISGVVRRRARVGPRDLSSLAYVPGISAIGQSGICCVFLRGANCPICV